MKNDQILSPNMLYHVHTFRCGHAEQIEDEAYIRKAISLGAQGICFSDHNPFPDDRFLARMRYSELEGYLSEIYRLKEIYRRQNFRVLLSLEVDYLPEYEEFYQQLSGDERVDFLMLGQHIAHVDADRYTYNLKEEEKESEYLYLGRSALEAMDTELFPYMAHPDRIFRNLPVWTPEAERLKEAMVEKARKHHIYLEKNRSVEKNYGLNERFWKEIPEDIVIRGIDAHCLADLEEGSDTGF